MDAIALVLAAWGAGLSTFLAFARRRARLILDVGFGSARLGRVRNHTFFVVSAVNPGQRSVAISEIEWEVEPGHRFVLDTFDHSKGRDLPVKVEPDEEVRILFDPDVAANAIARNGAKRIVVRSGGRRKPWAAEIDQSARDEAHELLEFAPD